MPIPVPDDDGGFKRYLPPEGRQNAVCCDVHDLGMIEQDKYQSTEKEQVHMILLVFAVGNPQGEPYRNPETGWPLTVAQRYRLSLFDQAKLHKVIKRWRNNKKPLTEQQLAALRADIERPLLGVPAELSIHYSPDGKYANIDDNGLWIEPLPAVGYVPMVIPQDYVRIADRPPKEQQGQQAPQQRQGATPPAHAAQRAGQNAFAQGADDAFGGPVQQQSTYDDFQAPPLDERSEDEMNPNHPDFLPF
jgi:hypothetical protein